MVDHATKPINGGWSFSGFSNPEQYAMSLVVTFQREMLNIQMDDVGTFAGNAHNRMIEVSEDNDFIELSNLSYIQSHGSPYGADLTYVPSILSTYDYRWGDDGKLQWVVIGGCEVLGYPRNANGSPAPGFPSINRWNRAFQGISGILGYRSKSYYAPDSPGIGESAASIFVRELSLGQTFPLAWSSAADYVHRTLNHQADIATFASSANVYDDTLSKFDSSRRIGLDIASVSHAIVGKGDPPIYDYNELASAKGDVLYREKLTRLNRKISIIGNIELDVFTSPILKVEQGADPLTEMLEQAPQHYSIGECVQSNYSRCGLSNDEIPRFNDLLTTASQMRSDHVFNALSNVRTFGFAQSVRDRVELSQYVEAGGCRFPILDYGLTMDRLEDCSIVRMGNIVSNVVLHDNECHNIDENVLVEHCETRFTLSDRVDIVNVKRCYQFMRRGVDLFLEPVVAVYVLLHFGDKSEGVQFKL